MSFLAFLKNNVCYAPDDATGGGGGTPWYGGASADVQAHIAAQGWREKTAAEVAVLASASHHQATKFIGKPENERFILPGKDDKAGQAALWQRFGAGTKAEDYDFSAVKGKDDKPLLSESVAKAVQQVAFDNHVPKDMAAAIARTVAEASGAESLAARQAAQTLLDTDKATLKTEWGAGFEANMTLVKQGAKTLGLDKNFVDGIEGSAGYLAIMKGLANIGKRLGEDPGVDNSGGGGGGQPKTKETASTRYDELAAECVRDVTKRKEYEAKGPIFKEMWDCAQIMAGIDPTKQ